ncbi:tail fiber assembly protein [Pseudomonas sp. LF-5]|uniref:tail fiber assembly protein n=1 Tax=Pseudomonas TaxID=286 RepID=UPI0030B0CCE5
MRYALINMATTLVENVIELDPEGDLTQPDGYAVVASDSANIGDTYGNDVFTPPPLPVLTPEQILAANTQMQVNLMYVSPQAISALFMAVDLGSGTDPATVKARAWQAYYNNLQAVDLTVVSPEWPMSPMA